VKIHELLKKSFALYLVSISLFYGLMGLSITYQILIYGWNPAIIVFSILFLAYAVFLGKVGVRTSQDGSLTHGYVLGASLSLVGLVSSWSFTGGMCGFDYVQMAICTAYYILNFLAGPVAIMAGLALLAKKATSK